MKVLVVIDMQNDFITGSLGTLEAVKIVPRVAEKIAAFDGTILFTQDTHTDTYLDTQEGKNLPVTHCIKGTEGWELHRKIREEEGTTYQKDTFGSTELANRLYFINHYEQIEEITLVGVCTDICVISNALLIKAFLPEVLITVDAACCAGVTPESHENALSAMRMCQINIING